MGIVHMMTRHDTSCPIDAWICREMFLVRRVVGLHFMMCYLLFCQTIIFSIFIWAHFWVITISSQQLHPSHPCEPRILLEILSWLSSMASMQKKGLREKLMLKKLNLELKKWWISNQQKCPLQLLLIDLFRSISFQLPSSFFERWK